MTEMEINALRAKCLINASNILGVMTEAASSGSDKPKAAKELEEAIKSRDAKTIGQKVDAYREWYNKIEPDKKHKYWLMTLKLIVSLVQISIYFVGVLSTAGASANLAVNGITKAEVVRLIVSLTACIGSLTSMSVGTSRWLKYNKENAEADAKHFEKEAEKIKKELDKIEDKNSSVYKAMNKLYIRTVNCAASYKALATQNKIDKNVKDAKEALKVAKKSKDKGEIARAKNTLELAKGGHLNESVEEVTSMNIVDAYRTLTEAASVLLEQASEADKVEDAQELIEKAQEFQDKAIDLLDDIADAEDEEEKKEDKKEEKTTEEKKEALAECIDLLLEKAILCENAEDAQVYIDKAEECQKAIDEIPEEKPEVDDEYPEDTSGGDEMPAEHLEAIKDLVDDDKKALELLTVDEGSLTIDE